MEGCRERAVHVGGCDYPGCAALSQPTGPVFSKEEDSGTRGGVSDLGAPGVTQA